MAGGVNAGLRVNPRVAKHLACALGASSGRSRGERRNGFTPGGRGRRSCRRPRGRGAGTKQRGSRRSFDMADRRSDVLSQLKAYRRPVRFVLLAAILCLVLFGSVAAILT